MNILSAQNLKKTYGDKLLFDALAFGIGERERVGLIGVNGSGKSTLLKMLARAEPADGGLVTTREGLRVEYLPQTPEFDPEHSVLEHLFAARGETARLIGDYEEVGRELAAAPAGSPEHDGLARRYDDLTRRIEAAGAWDWEARARTILGKLGIVDLTARLGTLSGGQKKRVALAHALLAEADLLILDEPTNHLDADTIAWLEGALARFPGAVLLVTHDRYFLDRVTTRIFELDRARLRVYEGNYAFFLEKKAELAAEAERGEERRRNILRNELEWLKRGARARTTKQKARIDRYHELAAKEPDKPQEKLRFEIAARRLGRKVVDLKNVEKSLGGRLLVRGLSHNMTPGERLGIIGPNGSGKSTLVNLITGRLAPDAGSVESGPSVAFGYYDQEARDFDLGERAIDYVRREGGENLKCADGSVLGAPQMMERFHFTSTMLYAPVGKLSGGERRRLYLVSRLLRDPNFLILDEPTNDLDIQTLEALEDFLETFGGCLIVISHDRYFLDRTVDRVLAAERDGAWRFYPGSYSVYEEIREEELEEEKKRRAGAAARSGQQRPQQGTVPEKSGGKSGRLSYKEQRELEQLEADIPRAEQRMAEISDETARVGGDYGKLKPLLEEQAALAERLEKAMARWEELAARV